MSLQEGNAAEVAEADMIHHVPTLLGWGFQPRAHLRRASLHPDMTFPTWLSPKIIKKFPETGQPPRGSIN